MRQEGRKNADHGPRSQRSCNRSRNRYAPAFVCQDAAPRSGVHNSPGQCAKVAVSHILWLLCLPEILLSTSSKSAAVAICFFRIQHDQILPKKELYMYRYSILIRWRVSAGGQLWFVGRNRIMFIYFVGRQLVCVPRVSGRYFLLQRRLPYRLHAELPASSLTCHFGLLVLASRACLNANFPTRDPQHFQFRISKSKE